MINVSFALAMLALAAAAPQSDPPDKSRGAKPAEAAGQRVEPPCAGPACPVPVPYPAAKQTTPATPGTPTPSEVIIPLCPAPSGGTPQSTGNEPGSSSGGCTSPSSLGPPPDIRH